MQSINSKYDIEKSLVRIDDILNSTNDKFEEKNKFPVRDSLTFDNGFYVKCTALFVDIRHSSDMTDEHTRPVLAKIYRSFISEMVALINGHPTCKEININGDCVWGVFETPYKSNIDDIIKLAAKVCSLSDILNYKLSKKRYINYKIGVGVDYGRALMIKAGYKGSTINDVIWMGDVVNSACHLCNSANQSLLNLDRVLIANVVYNNLSDDNKKLFSFDYIKGCYKSNIYDEEMNSYIENE